MANSAFTLADIGFLADTTWLLQDFNLTVPTGSCTVIMGPSGCGKSTVLKIAAGLTVPQQGRVDLLGTSLDDLSPARNIELRSRTGFVFQDAALWANKSIQQNIDLPLQFHFPKLSAADRDQRIRSLCQQMAFTENLNNRPSQISLGEQKIASFLRALSVDPDLLFLDDPTSSMDGQSVDRLVNILLELKKRGKTLVMVTQTPEITAKLADRLVIMKAGKILTEGPFAEVVRNPDPAVIEILTAVLSQAATFDNDILDLLSQSQEGGFF